MSTIDGPALLGFGDFFSGDSIGDDDDIGAAKKPAAKKTPGGKGAPQIRKYAKPARTQAVQKHGKVLKHSRAVATKAAKAIGAAQYLLSRKPAVATPAAKLSGRTVHVGASVAAKMTPKAKLAVQKHNDAVAKAKKASQVLAQHAIKTRDAVKVLAKKMVAQKKTSKLLRTPLKKRRAHIGALLADPATAEATIGALEAYYEAVGAEPDPANPGMLTDGSADPAAAPPSDADLGLPADAAGDVVDSGTDLPAPPPMDTFIADMNAVGGIAYDGSKGTPNGYVGSYGLMTRKTDHGAVGSTAGIDGTEHHGVVWGQYNDEGPEKGVPWGDDEAFQKDKWNRVHGRYILGTYSRSAATTGKSDGTTQISDADAFASYKNKSAHGVPYGPLVGNPALPDFAAMRVDGNGNMFWLPQEAPDWLTFPIKQAAALTAQAAKKAEEEAAKAAAAAEAKARADEAAAKAAQDAANALAESAAASEAKIAQGTEVTKQAQAETEGQQALVKQQAADTEAQAIETEQTKQAGTILLSRAQEQAAQDKQVADMLIAQAKQEQAYYAAHPEERAAPAAEADEDEQQMAEGEPPLPGMDSGGSEGAYDDGAPVPGGDLMADVDGENFAE